MEGALAGFDWDDGNRSKCLKHGVSGEEVESLFIRPIMILPDEAHSVAETRFKAIGRTAGGRHVFLVFTIREQKGKRYIRPISARYMHRKEIRHYEKENPNL
ncbi:MAG TPA: BrnT family toxin [Terriglobia bacterium]|nr:BrnT family toxin [Terriglobia bacterium]